jgi:hypothetical protein
MAFVLSVLCFGALPASAFFKGEGLKVPASYNRFASSHGFGSTMFLSKSEPGPKGRGTSFTYMLNDCVGALGMADNGEDLNDLFINATGCQDGKKSDALIHLLLFVADQCSPPAERSEAGREMLAAFQALARPNSEQTIELGTCKIKMQRSDVVGFMALVQ